MNGKTGDAQARGDGLAPLAMAVGGLAALAGAMGLGRFLLTPALPMMAAGTGLAPAEAGLLASANFAGYLVGALAATLPVFGRAPRPWLLLGLAASAATTGAMALGPDAGLWLALRAAGGAASALVLVTGSALGVGRLAAAGRPELAAVHFAGVGVGMALSAVLAAPPLAAGDGWEALWAMGGAATLACLAVAAALLPRAAPAAAPPPVAAAAPPSGLWRLVAAYGCLGFGYVVTATFIVTALRESDAGRWAESGVWLAVGLAAIPSVALWGWAGRRLGALRAFRLAMLVEAAGVALGAVATGALALGLAAVALGGTFMGLTALGLQEAARRAGPAAARRAMGLMTASFGTGQMLGPALAGWLREATGGYAAPSLLAAAVLVVGAGLAAGLAARDRRAALRGGPSPATGAR